VTKTKNGKTAAGYLRVSQARDGMLADSIYRQEIEGYASAYGYRLVEVFADLDFSGRKGAKARPAFTTMLERRDEFDLIIVPKLSRFGRSMKDNLAAYDLLEGSGVGIAFLDLRMDTTTSGGKLMRNVLTALAEYESDLISERWKDTHRYLAKNGRHLGGVTVPFGYQYADKQLSPHPTQAPEARLIFERFAAGWGLRAIARDLNERGVTGQRGSKVWNQSRIVRILDNPTFAGYRHYGDELTEGQWEPLIDRELWERVRLTRMATKASRPALNRKGKGGSLLSELLTCTCGAPMWRSTTSNPARSTYECSKSARKREGECRAGGVAAGRVENIVTEAFMERIAAPFAAHVRTAPDKAFRAASPKVDSTAQLAVIDRKLETLVRLMLASPGPATDAIFRRQAEALEAERAEVSIQAAREGVASRATRARADSLDELRARAADLRAVWAAATVSERNEMLRTAINSVRVLPGRARLKEFEIDWVSALEVSAA
jgi:site-specific DNA recombinase